MDKSGRRMRDSQRAQHTTATEGNMFDTFLRVGSSFDWITPTIALIQDIRNGPSVQFAVPHDTGWSGADIKQMLHAAGIRVWGLAVEGDEIAFTVRKAQARYAAYWLERERLPYVSSLGATESVSRRPQRRQTVEDPRPARQGGPVDNLLDGITGFVDGI
jgi:hypothetical protein